MLAWETRKGGESPPEDPERNPATEHGGRVLRLRLYAQVIAGDRHNTKKRGWDTRRRKGEGLYSTL